MPPYLSTQKPLLTPQRDAPARPVAPRRPRARAIVASAHGDLGRPRLASHDAARMLNGAEREQADALLFANEAAPPPPLRVEGHDAAAALGANRVMLSQRNESFLIGNRGGVTGLHLGQNPALPINASVFSNTGAVGGGANVPVLHDANGTLRLGLDALGGRRWLGNSASATWFGDGCRVGLGVGLFGNTDASLRIIGLARDHGGPSDSEDHLVQWSQYTGPGISLDPAALAHTVGVGAKMVWTRGKQVVFRTVMSTAALREVLHDAQPRKDGLLPLGRRLALSTQCRKAPLQIPEIGDPLGRIPGNRPLLPGESLVVHTSGSHTFGLAPGVLGARLGAFCIATGEFEIAAHCMDDGRIQIAVSPRQVHSLSVGGDLLVLADLRHQNSVVQAMRDEVIIDPQQPEAMAYYQQLITDRHDIVAPEPEQLHAEIAARPAIPGVEYLLREAVRTDKDTWSSSLGPHKGHPSEVHAVSDGQSTLLTTSAGSSREVTVPWLGKWLGSRIRSTDVSRIEQVAADAAGGRSFVNLAMHTSFQNTKARGWALNEMVRMLRRAFDLPTDFFSIRAHGQDYRLSVGREIGDELGRLSHVGAAEANAVAARCGVPVVPLRSMLRNVAGMDDVATIAPVVQRFVARYGAYGMGAVHRLCGGTPEDLQVHVETSDLAAPLQDFAELQSRNATLGLMAPHAVVWQVKSLKNQLDVSLQAVQNDPILPANESLRDELLQARGALQTLAPPAPSNPLTWLEQLGAVLMRGAS